MTTSRTTGVNLGPGVNESFIVAATRESDGQAFVQQLLGGQVHRWLDAIAEQRGHAEPIRTPRVSPRTTLPASVRLAIFERDAYRCRNCGDHHDLTIDHIVPVSRGGSDESTNLQTLCRPCNSSKGNRVYGDET